MTTERLIRKYKEDTLDESELIELRHEVNAMSDEELARFLEDGEEVVMEAEDVIEMKEQLWRNLSEKIYGSQTSSRIRYFATIAAVLLPLLIFGVGWLYMNRVEMVRHQVVLSTGKGEKVQITLPDGTHVWLNENSCLSYRLSDLSSRERKVEFSGEAYFDVARDKGSFYISNEALNVRVHGTRFNLLSYSDAPRAVLSLEEGKVDITSIKTNRTIRMSRGDVVTLSCKTGDMALSSGMADKRFTAWQRNELVLEHTSFSDICHQIELTYGLKIELRTNRSITGTFSGVLPTNNLPVALNILERLYGIKTILHGHILTIAE